MICGMFQHIESFFPLAYSSSKAPPSLYEHSIRVVDKKILSAEEDKWLREEDGSSFNNNGTMHQDPTKPTLETNIDMKIHATCQLLKLHYSVEEEGVTADGKRKRVKFNQSPMLIDEASVGGKHDTFDKASRVESSRRTMKILSWICRVLGINPTICELRDLMSSYIPNVVFLMEVKVDKMRVEEVRYRIHFDGLFYVPYVNHGGGYPYCGGIKICFK